MYYMHMHKQLSKRLGQKFQNYFELLIKFIDWLIY